MKPFFWTTNRIWIGLGLIAFTAIPFYWQHSNRSFEDEKIPEIVSIANAPELRMYVEEFSKPLQSTQVVAMSERPEPYIPFDHKLIQGKVVFANHETNASLWAIQSYLGKTWLDVQKFYIYSDTTKKLEEVSAFADKKIYSPIVVSTGETNSVCILVPVWTMDNKGSLTDWADELWVYQFPTKAAIRVTFGHWVDVSPDRSKMAFWRSSRDNFLKDGGGFHCLYIWDFKTGQIASIISMWESDPGSGRSWDLRWSADSKAINIVGSCGGFSRGKHTTRAELNLIYLVRNGEFYSAK